MGVSVGSGSWYRRDVQLFGALWLLEVGLLAAYVLGTPSQLTRPRYALYPFVWINVGLLAVYHADPAATHRGWRVVAASVAGAYLLALLWVAGLVGLSPADVPADLLGVSLGVGSPGWERVRLVTELFYVTLVPFRVVGYLALSYLVYVTVIDARAAALTGVLGLFSCLSCSVWVMASLLTGVLGGVSSLYAYSLDISTAVFVVTVLALSVRPTQRME